MISFHYEHTEKLYDERLTAEWISQIIIKDGFEVGEINFIFCDDTYLLGLNQQYLKHDTLTDVISFDNSLSKLIAGDIFISAERVAENAKDFQVSFHEEIHRVMVHGVLHFMGFKDKTDEDKKLMRTKENTCLSILNN